MESTSFPGYATLDGQRVFFASFDAFADAAVDPSLIDSCQYESAPDHGDYILSLHNLDDGSHNSKETVTSPDTSDIFPGYVWSDYGRIYFESLDHYLRFQMNPDFIFPEQLANHGNHQNYIQSLSERFTSKDEQAAKYKQLCIRKGLIPAYDRDSFLLRTTDVITSSIMTDNNSALLQQFGFDEIYSCLLRAMKDFSGAMEFVPSLPQLFPSGEGYRPVFQSFHDFFRDPDSVPLYYPPKAPEPPASVELITDSQSGFHFLTTVDRAHELPSELGVPSTLQEVLDFVAPSLQRTYRPLKDTLSSTRRRFSKPVAAPAAPYPFRHQIVLPTPSSKPSLGPLTDASTLPVRPDSPSISMPSLISDMSSSTNSSKLSLLDPRHRNWKRNVRSRAAALLFPHLLHENGDAFRLQYENSVQSTLLDSSLQYTATQVEQLLQSLLQRVILRTPIVPAPVSRYSLSPFGDDAASVKPDVSPLGPGVQDFSTPPATSFHRAPFGQWEASRSASRPPLATPVVVRHAPCLLYTSPSPRD